jgi:hypothetical protein
LSQLEDSVVSWKSLEVFLGWRRLEKFCTLVEGNKTTIQRIFAWETVSLVDGKQREYSESFDEKQFELQGENSENKAKLR